MRSLFLIEALSLALLIPRYPDLAAKLDLSKAQFGICIAFLPLGALLGFSMSQWMIARFGARSVSGMGVLALSGAVSCASTVTHSFGLIAFLFVAGLCSAFAEVAMNLIAGAQKTLDGRGILSSCHGFWSLGMVLGVLLGGLFSQWQIALPLQGLGAFGFICLALAIIWQMKLVPTYFSNHDETAAIRRPVLQVPLPKRAFAPITFVFVAGMLVEGAMTEWSAIHMRDHGAAPLAASLAFLLFSIAMMIVRWVGDALFVRLGIRAVSVVSFSLSAAGLGAFGVSDDPVSGAIAAVLCGLGSGLIYPAAISTMTSVGGSIERNIGSFTFATTVALSLAPIVVGVLAEHIGLSWVLSCASIIILLLGLTIRDRRL